MSERDALKKLLRIQKKTPDGIIADIERIPEELAALEQENAKTLAKIEKVKAKRKPIFRKRTEEFKKGEYQPGETFEQADERMRNKLEDLEEIRKGFPRAVSALKSKLTRLKNLLLKNWAQYFEKYPDERPANWPDLPNRISEVERRLGITEEVKKRTRTKKGPEESPEKPGEMLWVVEDDDLFEDEKELLRKEEEKYGWKFKRGEIKEQWAKKAPANPPPNVEGGSSSDDEDYASGSEEASSSRSSASEESLRESGGGSSSEENLLATYVPTREEYAEMGRSSPFEVQEDILVNWISNIMQRLKIEWQDDFFLMIENQLAPLNYTENEVIDVFNKLFRIIFADARSETIGTPDFNDYVAAQFADNPALQKAIRSFLQSVEVGAEPALAQRKSESMSISPGGTPPGTPPPPRKRWQEGQAGTAVEPPPAMIPVSVEPAPAAESSRLTQMLNQPHVKSVFVQAFLEAQKAGRNAIQPNTEAKKKRRLVPSQMDAVKRLGTVTLRWDNARDYGRNKPYVGSTILEWLLKEIRGEESRDAKHAFYSYLVNFLFTQLTYAEYVLTNYLGGFDNLAGRIGNDKAKETYAWLVNTWFVDNPQEVPSVTDVQGGLGYLVQGFPETREPISRKKKTPLSSPVRQPPLPVRIVPEREESVVILPTPARVLPALSTSISAFFPSPEEYETNKKPGMPASSYEQQLQIVRTWLDAIQTKSGLQSDEELLANFRQFFEGYYDDEDFDKYSRLTAERLFYTIFFYAKPETIGTREFNDYVLREDIFLGFVEDYEEYSLIRAFLAQFEKKPKLVVPPPAPSAGKGKEELSEEAPPPSVRAAPAEQQAQAEAIATPLTELLSQPHNRTLLETAFNMARDAALPTDLAQQKKVAKSLPTNLDAALQKFEPFTKAKSTYTISAVVGYLTQSFKSPNKEANVAFWKALLGFIYNQLMPAFKFINARFVNFDGWKTKLQSFPSGETLAMATYHWLVWEWFVSHAPSDEPTAQDFARAFQSEQQIWSQVFGVRVVSEASLSSSESRRVPTKQRRTVPEEPAMIPVPVPEPAPEVPNKWEQFLGRFNATEDQVRRMLLWTFGDEATANSLFNFIRNKATTAANPLTLELDPRIMKVLVNASQVDQFEKREQEELERQRKVPKTKFERFLERFGTTERQLKAYLNTDPDTTDAAIAEAVDLLRDDIEAQEDPLTAKVDEPWAITLQNSSQMPLEPLKAALSSAMDALIGCNACGKAKPKTQSSCCNGKMRYCGQACADRHWNAGHRKCCTGPGRKQ